MSTLRFELRSSNPHESFAAADAWAESVDGWRLELDQGMVSATDEGPGTSAGTTADGGAGTGIERVLRAWQLAAYLAHQHEIWFAGSDGQAEELFPGREHVFRRSGAAYPRPDPEFAMSPAVERMLASLRAQMSGTAGPATTAGAVLATAGAVLAALEEATPSPEAAYNVDGAVLAMLRDLVARGQSADLDLYRAYRGPEWQWLQEAVRLLMLQAGRARPGAAPAAALTMESFRTELWRPL